MIKRILRYVLLAFGICAMMYFVHDFTLNMRDLYLSYSLLNVYVFNLVASVLIYVMIDLIAEKLPSQAGYAFLASVFFKIGFFVLFFQDTVFAEVRLELYQRLSLIIPFFTFIIIESIAIAKLLNFKDY